ncbi:MAG: hypothetical protein HRU07_05865 [Nitrosopumilus sp.]|nr:hypothetical protein [Nitrosopumilus sp.]NRA05672.1 hypothetical protein [Nitrosopumilus sp.]
MFSFSPLVDLSHAQQFVSDKIEIFVPEKMIVGESYQGMVTLINPSTENSLALISTNGNFVLKTDASVNISPNQNHGIFNITPLNEGTAEIFISYEGELISTSSTIYSEKSGPQKLKVVLPGNSTIANDLRGFVFLLDGNGSPVESNRDMIIGLIPSEKIIVPRQVTILNGTTNTSFDMTIRASGDITAMATDMVSDTASITKSQQIVNVKMKIRPNIAAEDTPVNYFIWLEKDGKPFTVPHVLKLELQSSNTDVLRLGVSPSSYKNVNTITVSMNDGIVKGQLFTGESGVAEIFVSIQNYGHASEIVSVGPAVLVDGQIIDEDILSERTNLEPNHIEFGVYPSVTDDVAYGVASLYYSETIETLEITVDESGTQVTNLVEQLTLIPLKSEDVLISISSESGLKHNSNYLIDGAQFPTHSKLFEITAENVGDYTITATGGNSYDSADLTVTTTYNSQYSILVTPLPIRAENTQPLMMISIVDEDGNILDVRDSFGSSLSLDIHTVDSVVGASSILLGDNVGIISGILNGIGSITVSSDKFGPTELLLVPSGVPVSIEFLSPENVHMGEAFPVAIHEIDATGIPISKKNTQTISSSGFKKINEGLISVDASQGQQISILSQIGGAYQKFINSFTNEISFDVESDADQVRIGKPVIIRINSPLEHVEYTIDSPFPYEQIDDKTFSVTPDREINNAIITIIGKLDGFSTMNKEVVLSSQNVVELKITAKNSDGKTLSPKYQIHHGETIEESTAPKMHLIKPAQTILEFPQEWSTVSAGYKLVSLYHDGVPIDGQTIDFYADKDSVIEAVYDRFVKVMAIDSQGSGIYQYGETILISAPNKQKISFLVVETFDYWIGSDEKSSVFAITLDSDIVVTAVYRDDYTVLMGLILAGVIVFVILLIRKGDSAYRYRLEGIIDEIVSTVKPLIPLSKK